MAYAAVVLCAVDADEHAVRQHRPARFLGATVEALGVACPRTEGVQLRVDLLVDQAGSVLHGLSLTLRLLLDVLALHGQEVRHAMGSAGCSLACEKMMSVLRALRRAVLACLRLSAETSFMSKYSDTPRVEMQA